MLISLAPDWSPTGSKSILGELKIADVINRFRLDRLFSDRELVAMVTRNPAIALGWGAVAGQIAPGFLGDVVVVDAVDDDPYRNLIRATETHVKLVAVRGEPLYGDAAVMQTVKMYRVSLPDGATKLTRQYELLRPRLVNQRQKAVDFKKAGIAKGDVAANEMMERLERAMTFNRRTLRQRIPAAQVTKDLRKCTNVPAPASPPSTEDFQRFLACTFPGGLPATPLDPLFTAADDDFFRRLEANPNIPVELRGIREFYRTP